LERENFYLEFEKELATILKFEITSLKETDSLIDLGLDSLNMVHLIVFIEQLLCLELPIEEYSFNNFTTMQSIYDKVISKYSSVTNK